MQIITVAEILIINSFSVVQINVLQTEFIYIFFFSKFPTVAFFATLLYFNSTIFRLIIFWIIRNSEIRISCDVFLILLVLVFDKNEVSECCAVGSIQFWPTFF